jgi:copper chaperone CopZ
MKLKSYIVFFSLLSVALACSNQETTDSLTTQEQNENFSVEANAVAIVKLSGMTCEMGCGSEVRKGLKASGAVASTEFVDFDSENEFNTAKVSFDASSLTESDIKKIIEGLNEGQFTVGTIEIIPMDGGANSESSSSSKEDNSISMSETYFEFPNLLGLLSSLVL